MNDTNMAEVIASMCNGDEQARRRAHFGWHETPKVLEMLRWYVDDMEAATATARAERNRANAIIGNMLTADFIRNP